jgi:hypothetical protein
MDWNWKRQGGIQAPLAQATGAMLAVAPLMLASTFVANIGLSGNNAKEKHSSLFLVNR